MSDENRTWRGIDFKKVEEFLDHCGKGRDGSKLDIKRENFTPEDVVVHHLSTPAQCPSPSKGPSR